MIIGNVLSFDSKKVRLIVKNNSVFAEKHTTKFEYEQILLAHEYIAKTPFFLEKYGIIVKPAEIADWDESQQLLTTVYCDGINMEHKIRSVRGKQRLKFIYLFKDFLQGMANIGFLWGGCAPRNIILDKGVKSFKLVDFERKSIFGKPVSKSAFSRHIRNYALEEFSCFLFAEEQDILFSGIIAKNEALNISQVNSKRKKKLLELMFGKKTEYEDFEIYQAEKSIVRIATPIMEKKEIFYPMDILSTFNEMKGAENYAKLIIKLQNANEIQRIFEFHKIAQFF